LTGASKTPQLENQLPCAFAKGLCADLPALLFRRLKDGVENRLGRIESRFGPLGNHQAYFRCCRRLTFAYENLDCRAISVLIADHLPILPAYSLRQTQLIAGRPFRAASRDGRASRGASQYQKADQKRCQDV